MLLHKPQPVKVQLRLRLSIRLCVWYPSGNQSTSWGLATKSCLVVPSLIGRVKKTLIPQVSQLPIIKGRHWLQGKAEQQLHNSHKNFPTKETQLLLTNKPATPSCPSRLPIPQRILLFQQAVRGMIHVSLWCFPLKVHSTRH